MTPKQKLESILAETYISEDGEVYKVELKKGLSNQQIHDLANKLPTGKIPAEITELLTFASGFEFYGLEDVTFDELAQFGFEAFFPNAILLAGDGFGNFWILDIDKYGNWGCVFYVCHDPAVIVKHSENLSEFIEHVHEFGKTGASSNLDIIHEKTVMHICNKENGIIDIGNARQSGDKTLQNFASSLNDNYVFADLRNKSNKSGFAWGKFQATLDKTKRHETALIWAMEKPAKKTFLAKLFGR